MSYCVPADISFLTLCNLICSHEHITGYCCVFSECQDMQSESDISSYQVDRHIAIEKTTLEIWLRVMIMVPASRQLGINARVCPIENLFGTDFNDAYQEKLITFIVHSGLILFW